LNLFKIVRDIKSVLFLIMIIWVVWAVDLVNDQLRILPDINSFGIIPRTLRGLAGIFIAPLLHGNLFHLMGNTIPLFFLALTIIVFYKKTGPNVFWLIYFLSGILLWCFGRNGNHIGISGVIFGLFAFLIVSGFLRWKFLLVVISLVIGFVYGGSMLFGMLPTDKGVSWDGHIIGAITGIAVSYYYRKAKD
jgi:membrane associated rhomboid family serine protease